MNHTIVVLLVHKIMWMCRDICDSHYTITTQGRCDSMGRIEHSVLKAECRPLAVNSLTWWNSVLRKKDIHLVRLLGTNICFHRCSLIMFRISFQKCVVRRLEVDNSSDLHQHGSLKHESDKGKTISPAEKLFSHVTSLHKK